MAESEDYTIVANTNYATSTYEAPGLFLILGSVVEKIVVGRDADTPNSILAFASGDRAEQVEYIEGLVGIGIFLSCLVSIWFLTLLLFKCQGRDRVGCAAGFAFHDADSDNESLVEERRKRGGASGTLFRGDGQDVSVGAAVGEDDSVAMDEPTLREKRRKSLQSKTSRLSSRLSSVFGSKKSKDNSQMSSELSNRKSKAAVASFGGGKDGRKWTVFQDDNYPDENCTSDSKHFEEIELHMELDNIVQSATQESEKKGEGKDGGKLWTLRSLPKTIVIDDASDDESIEIRRSQAKGSSSKTWGETACCSFQPKHVLRRKVQTRLVFGFFAIVSLVCSTLLVTHMYLPLESAALTTGEVVREASQIVEEINEVLEVVDEAASVTVTILKTTPLQYEGLCPEFPIGDFIAQFGFNPTTVIDTVSKEYQNYIPTIVELLNTAQETGASVTDVLVDVNKAVSNANEYLWIIPLVICVTILIIFSQLALMTAVVFKEQKFKDIKTEAPKVEDCYGWTILPLQIIVVLVSWILVIAFCFGIIITTDSCIPSVSTTELVTDASSTTRNTIDSITNSRGTPEDTIMAILDQYLVTDNENDATSSLVDDLAYRRLSTYITGCREDPLREVIVVQGLLQESLTYVDTQVSFANDVLGLEFIEKQCGPTNQVRLFFDNLVVLNEQFANVNRVIKQAYDALSCPRVNALYVEAVHGALCTDFATSNTNGLLLLIIISFSGMVLITLRAAWRSAA